MSLNSFQTSGNSPGPARCRVGVVGFGTLGSAIARRLSGPESIPSFELTYICKRRLRETRARQPDPLGNIVRTDRFGDLGDHAALVPAPTLIQNNDATGLANHQLAEGA